MEQHDLEHHPHLIRIKLLPRLPPRELDLLEQDRVILLEHDPAHILLERDLVILLERDPAIIQVEYDHVRGLPDPPQCIDPQRPRRALLLHPDLAHLGQSLVRTVLD